MELSNGSLSIMYQFLSVQKYNVVVELIKHVKVRGV